MKTRVFIWNKSYPILMSNGVWLSRPLKSWSKYIMFWASSNLAKIYWRPIWKRKSFSKRSHLRSSLSMLDSIKFVLYTPNRISKIFWRLWKKWLATIHPRTSSFISLSFTIATTSTLSNKIRKKTKKNSISLQKTWKKIIEEISLNSTLMKWLFR